MAGVSRRHQAPSLLRNESLHGKAWNLYFFEEGVGQFHSQGLQPGSLIPRQESKKEVEYRTWDSQVRRLGTSKSGGLTDNVPVGYRSVREDLCRAGFQHRILTFQTFDYV